MNKIVKAALYAHETDTTSDTGAIQGTRPESGYLLDRNGACSIEDYIKLF
jgi:hypothetical protein